MRIFCSYCHEDEAYKDKLKQHFAIMLKNREIEFWDDRELVAGQELDEEITRQLDAADVVIALISASYLSSHYCYEVEMGRAMQRHREGRAVVAPVLLRPCDWPEAVFAKGLVCPKDAKPVSKWDDKDEALYDAMTSIKKAIRKLGQTQRKKAAQEGGGAKLDAISDGAALSCVQKGEYAAAVIKLGYALNGIVSNDRQAADEYAVKLARAIAAHAEGKDPAFDNGASQKPETLSADACYQKASAYKYEKEYTKAIALLTQAITLDPHMGLAYAMRGDCYRYTGQYDAAMRDVNTALESEHPGDFIWTTCVKGNIYMDMGKGQEAFSCYQQALRSNPFYVSAYINMKNAYSKLGRRAQERDMSRVMHFLKDQAAVICKDNLENYFDTVDKEEENTLLDGYLFRDEISYQISGTIDRRLRIQFQFKQPKGVLFLEHTTIRPQIRIAHDLLDKAAIRTPFCSEPEPFKHYQPLEDVTGYTALSRKFDESAKDLTTLENAYSLPDGKYIAVLEIPVWFPGEIAADSIYREQLPFQIRQGNVVPVRFPPEPQAAGSDPQPGS